MKKLVLLTTLFLAFACSKDDEDQTKIDPIIGNWGWTDSIDNLTGRFSFNSNGNYFLKYSDDDEQTGTWVNTGENFSSTRQIYRFTESENDGGSIETHTIVFSADFNSWSWSDDEDQIWTRQ